MKTIAKTIIAAAAILALGGAASADPTQPAGTPSSPTTVKTGSLTVTTGSINTEPSDEQRMKDCMAIWEPRTHMSKSEWRRSCTTTLQSLSKD